MPHKQSHCFKQDKLHSKAKSAYYIKPKKKKKKILNKYSSYFHPPKNTFKIRNSTEQIIL